MNRFVLLSASTFIFLTYHILDQGLCKATQTAGLQRDPNKSVWYADFKENLYHALDVPKIEGVDVETESQCRLQCVKNDECFSINIGAFYLPNGKISCELLSTDKYSESEKFKASLTFHHYSIKVSITCISCNSACFLFCKYILLLRL